MVFTNLSKNDSTSEEAVEGSLNNNQESSEQDKTLDKNELENNTKNSDSENKLIKRSQGKASNVNVSIEVNSSMDAENLEKFLKLLKQYGAI